MGQNTSCALCSLSHLTLTTILQRKHLLFTTILHMWKRRHKKVKQFDQVIKPKWSDYAMYMLTIIPQLLSSSYHIPAIGFFDGTKFLLPNFSGWPNCLPNSPSSSPHMNIRSLSVKQTQPYSRRWLLDLRCISPYFQWLLSTKAGAWKWTAHVKGL